MSRVAKTLAALANRAADCCLTLRLDPGLDAATAHLHPWLRCHYAMRLRIERGDPQSALQYALAAATDFPSTTTIMAMRTRWPRREFAAICWGNTPKPWMN